jgi:zinc/manganese transport system substrate-binding protein
MKSMIVACVGVLATVFGVSAAQAKLNVFACEPEWAALTTVVGGDRVAVMLATKPLEDPEHTNATPGMISSMQTADLFVCTGVTLDESFLPAVIERSGNAKVADGQPGQFYASKFVTLLNDEQFVPHENFHHHKHAGGNGHIQGDPHNMIKVAAQLAKRLIEIDPEGKEQYTANVKKFIGEMNASIAEWEKKAAPLKGVAIASQHEHDLYTVKWLGMTTAATVEPEPGDEPGPADLIKLIKSIPEKNIKFIVYGAYENPKASQFVAEKTRIPVVKLPVTVGGTEGATNLITFYDDIINRLLDGLHGNGRT